MNEVKYGVLHCHSDGSIRDSAMTVQKLVERAKELGAPAVALTDHGNMVNYIEFIKCCQEAGINPIVGVEAYVEEQNEGRRHLILMAKDYKHGFKALIKAVSESNERTEDGFPRMNKEILMRNFGEGALGHGYVIATSACISGVLGALMSINDKVYTLIKKHVAAQKNLESPDSPGYQKNKGRMEEIKRRLSEISAASAELKKEASRSLLTLERKALNAPNGSAKKVEAQKAFREAFDKKSKAAIDLAKLNNEKAELTAESARLKPILQQMEKDIKKWQTLQAKIDAVMVNQIQSDKIDETLRTEAKWYQDTFGEDDFYIELQYHGFPQENEIMPKLAALALEMGIPTVLANDAHIPRKNGEDILARAIMRTTRFLNAWEEPTASDKEMYLKSDEELIEWVSKIIPEYQVMEAYGNIGKIASECHIEIPDEKHYPKFTTPDGSTSEEYLRKMAYEGIPKRYPNGFPNGQADYDRLEYELEIMCSMGYADYHCIVEDFLRYARAAGKLDLSDPEQEKLALSFDVPAIEKYTEHLPGETVGPGRGSAAGSLVCYLIGITNIDPLKYGLLFERFLNPERVTMPDIDCDIETTIRPYAIAYVQHKYGAKSVCGIMTRGKQTGKAAIQTAGRVYGLQKAGDTTEYAHIVSAVSKKAVELSDDELHIDLKGIEKQLKEEFKNSQTACEIVRYAVAIEGCMSQIGQHAAGIIITDGQSVDEYVPLIHNTKNDIMMTQCDMTQSEEIGLLKVDFLGLNNLTIITETQREIYKNTGKVIDMDHIPYDDPKVFQDIFIPGMTNSVFQFESSGMKGMLHDFKPDTIFDLILLVAMYRPGPMQFLPDVIAVKNGRKQVSYLTPELEPILSATYGSITYQEQVQEIFKQLAGYSLGQADLVRRAMSKKKDAVLRAEREAFIHGDAERSIPGCIANGISLEAANTLFDEMTDFAKYAFNKSHAACYAVVAYQTAWLKCHYPKEYMKSVLNNTAFDKVPGLMKDLKLMKISSKAPDVNLSDLGFTLYNGEIVFGLGSIKGLGKSVTGVVEERKAHGAFRSLQDFVLRTGATKKILEGFASAGAFDGFCKNRTAIMAVIPDYVKIGKKVKNYEKKLAEQIDIKKITSYQNKLNETKEKLMDLKPDEDICENVLEKLIKEKELLGVFASQNPMDIFPEPSRCGAIPIKSALEQRRRTNVMVTGIVSDYSIKRRRKDGAEMAFFTLSDLTESIDVCCFTQSFSMYNGLLSEDAVLKIRGNIIEEENGEKKLSVETIEPLKQKTKSILIFAKKSVLGGELQNLMTPYVAQNGFPCKIYDTMMAEFRDCDLLLSPAIIKDEKIYGICQKRPVLRDFGN